MLAEEPLVPKVNRSAARTQSARRGTSGSDGDLGQAIFLPRVRGIALGSCWKQYFPLL